MIKLSSVDIESNTKRKENKDLSPLYSENLLQRTFYK